jgi:L-galactose dehydrogenase
MPVGVASTIEPKHLVCGAVSLRFAPAFMKYRELGKTGWKISVLGLGASPLGGAFGKIPAKDGIRAVRTAVDEGINFIDVSPINGSSATESVLGEALAGIPRERFFLAAKVGRYGDKEFDFSPDRLARSVDQSLKRLRVAHIDLLLCQDVEFVPVPLVTEVAIPALLDLKRLGKVRAVGVSAYPLKVLRQLMDRAPLDAVLNYGHYYLSNITLVQLLPALAARRIGVINAAPLGMGLFRPEGPPAWHPAPAKFREVCAAVVALCRKRRSPLARLALQFALARPDIATTLIGMSSPKEVRENVRCLTERVDQDLLADVEKTLEPIRNQSWPSGLADNN